MRSRRRVARDLGARVIIVGPEGRAAGRLAAAGHARRRLRRAARDRRGARGPHGAGHAALRDAATRNCSTRRCRWSTPAGRSVPCGVTQSVDAIDRQIRRDQLALIGVGLLALALGLVVAWFVAGSLARPLRALAVTARRVGGGDSRRVRDRGVGRAARGRAGVQRDGRPADAALEAQRALRGQRVASAAHAADGPAPAHRGGRRWQPTTRPCARTGGGGRGDGAARPARHGPAEAGVGRRAGAAERARSTSRPRRARLRSAGAARRAQDGRDVALGDGAGDRCSHGDDVATSARQPDRERARALAARRRVDDHWGAEATTAFIAVLDDGPGHLTGGGRARRSSGSSAAPPGPRARRNGARPGDRRSARRALGRRGVAAPPSRRRYARGDTAACAPWRTSGFTLP